MRTTGQDQCTKDTGNVKCRATVPKTAQMTIRLDAIYNSSDTNHQILEILMEMAQGQPYHAHILYCLRRALPGIPNSENMPENEIKVQLKKYKEKLR